MNPWGGGMRAMTLAIFGAAHSKTVSATLDYCIALRLEDS